MIKKIVRLNWGEGALWLLFLLTAGNAAEGRGDDLVLLAGVFALAAIGVRATRPARDVPPDA